AAAKDAATAAGSADWDAQTAASVEDARKAAKDAAVAAATAQGIAGYGTPADKNALGIVFSLLAAVLDMAKNAATDAALIAGKDGAEGKPPIAPVIESAIKAINDSIAAAKTASLAARDGAQDAKVAADCVTSGVSMLEARAAENAAGKAMQGTVDVIAQSKATKIQVSTASKAAQDSIKPAQTKADAAGKVKVDDAKTALADAAAKAKTAADKGTAAMTAKEEAAAKADAADKADAAGKDAAVKAAKDAADKAKTATDDWRKAMADAADAEAKATGLIGDSVTAANDAATAGLMAADNATAAAEAVEKAAVATSQVSVQAAVSADVAAQAARAAVKANEEANQDPTLTIEAINEGEWGDNLEVTLTVNGTMFNLGIREMVVQNGVARQLNGESYSTITLEETAPANQKALAMVNHNSNLVRLRQIGPKIQGAYPDEVKGKYLDNGDNGGLANADQLITSMRALDGIEPALFNLLCLPAIGNFDDAQAGVAIAQAHKYCGDKRAFLIVDIPAKVKTVDDMLKWTDGGSYGNAKAYNMAVYFPRLLMPDPLNEYRPRNVGPSGTVAGIYSRTDTARGVWKAPAGIEAVIQGAEVAVRLNDDLNGQLNPRGINVLRSFPIYGQIVWGARTLAGADPLFSEYKYINVRRLMNYVEESIFRSMKWAVFEPNNESLWSKIRLQINGFLSGLYAQGAFQGSKPASAYFVRCDGTTTTPLDIDLGIVNVFVGIAPAKPAEFIILNFQQIAGQSA